ncbi:hypothetical protein GUJ93_ZPchr0013g37180 [Zizania palustris]|uniref:SAM domain-containing protein n=2 Tax=Zizania palustris TaxID=103762 RepID=A0A8J5WXB1_ZIZPA|nr:hypothetical protein GUJ93_ZPchr0013g37180 [Zizania palustris]KAG8098947.1 hypothetical protein GUJ93_ZPchr0013g37180 [Zizania palustris]KAG8098948.1 hypothetical protein GUJ93_ZPchr0013g37180 [Zizania palustris]KAG8098949.1 hypothetical protein GUJ93_ZPchr0013g37180 [Zizania palustris]
MADLHPPDPDTNGAGGTAATVVAPGEPTAEAAGTQVPVPPYSKRRRRPSVRLGEIGVQTAAAAEIPLPARRHKPSSSSHPRPPRRGHPDDSLDHLHPSSSAHRRGQKPAQRRARTALMPATSGADGYEDEAGHYYDDADQSDSAAAAARARVSCSRGASGDESDGVADWGLPNGRLPGAMVYGGVKTWLDGLGLSRYAPVFEIHEVDDEVLPLLTLEDLKDMGIGAIGSRRKMYAAIQKLQRSDGVS